MSNKWIGDCVVMNAYDAVSYYIRLQLLLQVPEEAETEEVKFLTVAYGGFQDCGPLKSYEFLREQIAGQKARFAHVIVSPKSLRELQTLGGRKVGVTLCKF